jgi:hypothetical protein
MADVNTPNFEQRSKNGEIIIGPLHVVKNTHTINSLMDVDVLFSWDDFTYAQHTGTYPPLMSNVTPVDSGNVLAQVKDAAIASAHTAASDSDALALASIAEAEKTIGLAASLLSDAYRMLRAVRRMRRDPEGFVDEFRRRARQMRGPSGQRLRTFLRNTSSVSDVIASQWLRYRYGLRTTAFELEQLYNGLTDERNYRFVARGFKSATVQGEVNSSFTAWSNPPVEFDLTSQQQVYIQAAAGIYLDIDFGSMSKLHQLGLDLILPTAWELVPYSFVADWFTNFGDLVMQYQPKRHRVLGSYVTTKQVTTTMFTSRLDPTRTPSRWNTADLASNSGSLGTITVETTEIIRTPTIGYASVPSLDIRLNAGRVADLVALIRQLF